MDKHEEKNILFTLRELSSFADKLMMTCDHFDTEYFDMIRKQVDEIVEGGSVEELKPVPYYSIFVESKLAKKSAFKKSLAFCQGTQRERLHQQPSAAARGSSAKRRNSSRKGSNRTPASLKKSKSEKTVLKSIHLNDTHTCTPNYSPRKTRSAKRKSPDEISSEYCKKAKTESKEIEVIEVEACPSTLPKAHQKENQCSSTKELETDRNPVKQNKKNMLLDKKSKLEESKKKREERMQKTKELRKQIEYQKAERLKSISAKKNSSFRTLTGSEKATSEAAKPLSKVSKVLPKSNPVKQIQSSSEKRSAVCKSDKKMQKVANPACSSKNNLPMKEPELNRTYIQNENQAAAASKSNDKVQKPTHHSNKLKTKTSPKELELNKNYSSATSSIDESEKVMTTAEVVKSQASSANSISKMASKHQLSHSPEENPQTPAKKNNNNSYEITPARSSFVSYDISEIKSDSDDEEDTGSKPVPTWASGLHLRNTLIQQHYTPVDTDQLFGNSFPAIDLVLIMGTEKKRYAKRTSSAVWNTTICSLK